MPIPAAKAGSRWTAAPSGAASPGLLAAACLWVALLGIAPLDRGDWLLENLLVAFGLGLALWRPAWLRLSRGNWWLLLGFLALHEVGAHYTYSRVPYDALWRHWTSTGLDAALGWRRNQFDRFVHLSYGLLVLPADEWLRRQLRLGRWTAMAFALSLVMATSALYELAEWVGGEYLGGDQSAAFLGTQDDAWDAQKDMALAGLGALLALGARGLAKRRPRGGGRQAV
ncbi:DUF2238 domain-containing protein [Pseudomonas sp. 273]|uniref:DUF2238 domain-containing protein n=1 Tax=Pseudomonas sp. 273 TaxID=75692 RepID=UPI0023D86E14|nr:DUF2238 domain-containing protein [Pseudomonas sp. 273]